MNVITWLLAPPASLAGEDIVAWWEIRRIPFNIIVGLYGFVCFVIFLGAIAASDKGGFEPLGLMAAPFVINAFYTLGWLVELPARSVVAGLPSWFGPFLLVLGIGLSMFLITIPAAYWVGYLLLQVVGAVP